MYLAIYKKGSSSLNWSATEDLLVIDDGSEAIAVDVHVSSEEGSEESLSVEEPMDETFVWRKGRLGPRQGELGEAGWRAKFELEEALGLGVGWMTHWENSSGTARPCAYSSFRCQQSVAVCP